MVPARGASKVYTFTPRPTGARWYHSHDVAGEDLSRGMYAGLYGFLIIEPASDPGRYDKRCCSPRTIGRAVGSVCRTFGRDRPPIMASRSCMPLHHSATGDPVRVREGERVLFRLLNASATENIRLALPGHRFTVLSLDGNPVPTAAAVDVVSFAPAERADVIAEMNRPGYSATSTTIPAKWVSASSSNTPISMASRNGPNQQRRPGSIQRLADRAPCRSPTAPSDCVREDPRRSGRLQPLDDQRQVMA